MMSVRFYGGPRDGQVIQVADHLRELVVPVIDSTPETLMVMGDDPVALAPRQEVYKIAQASNGRWYAVHPQAGSF